jgi:hypothetical protein
MELFNNYPQTTATSTSGTTAPSSGTTETWTVASSASFPAASTSNGNTFHVADPALPTEVIQVTNVSGTTWTVIRGSESSIPIAHATGATFKQVVTAGWLTAANAITAGTFSWLPSDQGLLAWNFDPAGISLTGTAMVSQTLYVMAISIHAPVTVSKAWFNVVTAATSLTSAGIALFNSSGTQIATSTATATFTSTGNRSATLTVTGGQSLTLQPGLYYLAVFNNGTGVASLGPSAAGNLAAANLNLAAATLRFSVNGTAVTANPASLTPASNTATGAFTFWAGLS